MKTLPLDTPQAKSYAQREADKPLKPAKPQEPCDIGLFSDDAAQTDLLDMVNNKVWAEYDSAADWCAARKLKGKCGDPLPVGLSDACLKEINYDLDAFERRVRAFAYGRAMEGKL